MLESMLYNPASDAIKNFSEPFGFLSNFYQDGKMHILIEGRKFMTSEAAYMSMKTDDPVMKDFFESNSSKPGLCKRYGKKVDLVPWWTDQYKIIIMEKILLQKFSFPHMKAMLLSTGDRQLIEGNNWKDMFWGVCDGQGCNHLGNILMEIRHECGPT